MPQYEVAVIGAGIAGLICARSLQQLGYRVVVLEKSRGVGGRIATRRLHNTLADHGVRYLTSQGNPVFQSWVQTLIDRGILQVWTETVHPLGRDRSIQTPLPSERYPRYVAVNGMTAVAKTLAEDLCIWRDCRAESVQLLSDVGWQIRWTASPSDPAKSGDCTAQALVVAIPAPQAVTLLATLSPTILGAEFWAQLRSVQFAPCITAIAGYSSDNQQPLSWQVLDCPDDPHLLWVGVDSSKRSHTSTGGLVFQSTACFAERFLQTEDLQAAAQELINCAAVQIAPWIAMPSWFQGHRWRFAFAQTPVQQPYLAASTALPLVGCGDWCGGDRVEDAFLSGLATAQAVDRQLRNVAHSDGVF